MNIISKQKIFIDYISIEDCIKNDELIKEYSKKLNILGEEVNLSFKICLNILTSKLLYKKNKSIKIENIIYEKKEDIETLSNCLSHIDMTLGRYFLMNYNNPNLNGFNNSNLPFGTNIPANEGFNPHNYNPNAKYLSNDMHYTEKVENYFLKIIGRNLFKWDLIIYFFNKIFFCLTLISWIFKFDMLTVIKY